MSFGFKGNPIQDLPLTQMYRDMSELGFYNLDSATLVRYEMRTYHYGFQVYIKLIESLQDGWHPLTCTEAQLAEMESLLQLPPRPRATLDQRRQTALALLSLGEGNFTPAGAEAALLAAGITAKIAEDFPNQRLVVTVEEFGAEYDSIYQCMERGREFLPAHMEVVFEFGGPDWGEWEGRYGTWREFDDFDLTWQERDRAA